MIVEGLLPFSFCENDRARQFMKYGPISRNTLMKYMGLLTTVVEKKIADKLPDKFALVFDGWSSCDSNHLLLFLQHSRIIQTLDTVRYF